MASVNWKTTFSLVRAALMRRGRTRDEADDLVQEAWIKLACYEQSHTVAKPEAFLMRAALNLSIDDFRAQQRHGEHELIEETLLADTAPTAEASLLARERIARVHAGLAGLDARTREIFLAHRLDGMSYLEIAREQGVSVSAVEKHIAKAALAIARSMVGWYP